ncbi:ComF family protein [Ardenticatena maritima]|uniref:ComF family protein n=1 Tax=Ardenticatena maritima TaxID=872965 RepID=UPI0009EA8CC7|nr:ComF family protein [Ardenticatena maritima]
MIAHLQRVVATLLDLLFPPACAVCRTIGTPLCPNCLSQWHFFAEPRCPRCDESLTPRHTCALPPALDHLLVVGPHTGNARRAVHALKYRRQRDVAEPLGVLMAFRVTALGFQPDLVVPVPIPPRRLAERGYNQAALLAHVVAREIGAPSVEALTRTRETPPQVGLSRRERLRNVAGAFAIAGDTALSLEGRRVLLVDDVCTTGATMSACAEVFRACGAAMVVGVVLSRSLPPSTK